MAYFDQDFLTFLKDLSANNNRDWFQANKKRYEESVKEPFTAFVGEMIVRMKKDDPQITLQPKDSIFRINRDIRFSADKTPYKTHMSALISRGGKKDKTLPGMYLHLGPDSAQLFSGVHGPEKDQLYRIRESISGNLGQFEKLINEKDFKKKFGTILGDKNKRIPKEFQMAFEKQPLIANKDFYYVVKFPAKIALDPKLPAILMDHYLSSKPLSQFLYKAASNS